MHLTMINGYEFGQLLRILLWICVPIAMGILLVTTWLQYRRRQKFADGLLLSVEGVSTGEEEAMASAYHAAGVGEQGGDALGRDGSGVGSLGFEEPGGDGAAINDQAEDDRVEEPAPRVAETFGEEDYKENLYKGILWMKDKYEQYRDMSDQRYERLKDQLTKVERRYEDLLASIGGSRPAVGVKPAEPRVQPETTGVEPMPAAEPVGMESMTMAERAGLESIIMVEPARPEEPRTEGPRVEAPVARVWSPEPRFEAAEATLIDREERTHIQELEEQLARTRQRLEEELGRVRHQLEEEIARSRRQQDEQAAVVEINRHLEQQMVYSNRQLEEKQRIIADLEGQLRSDKQKIEELVSKIRNNGQLLMKIYQELDKSLHLNDIPKEP
jgi:hypothetical protein